MNINSYNLFDSRNCHQYADFHTVSHHVVSKLPVRRAITFHTFHLRMIENINKLCFYCMLEFYFAC